MYDRPKSTLWTDQENETLLRGIAEGKNMEQLLKEIPTRTVHALISRAKKLKTHIRRDRINVSTGEAVLTPVAWPEHVRFDDHPKADLDRNKGRIPKRDYTYSLIGNSSAMCVR